ncbi:MAG: helix-turn-helix domain-containing protein [Streptosporangiaceae bacterium]
MTAEAVLTADAATGVKVLEAAPLLRIAPRTLRRWCASGLLAGHARKRGRVWFLNPEWVSAQVTWPSAGRDVA